MAAWAFVADMASATPTVNLNLNAAPWYVGPDFKLDPPDFSKARAGGLRAGQLITRSVPGNRQLSLPLQLLPSATPGANIEALCRQLAQDNILKVQLHTADPVFFRTFADPMLAATIRALLRNATTINLEIEAEPYAYGVREDLGTFTISNNPAVAGGCYFDVPAASIKGDSETPLLLLATSTGASGTPSGLVSKQVHLATRRRGVPSNLSNVIQAEDMTNGTDAADVIDALYSNGNKVTVSFATNAGLVLRLSDTFPGDGVATIEARGQYRVYARMAKTTAGDNIVAQLRYGSGATGAVANDSETLPATTNPTWIDLGLVPVPAYSDGVTMGYSGVQTKALMSFIGLYLQRVSGSGSVHVDCLYFMPADEPTTLMVKMPATDTTYAIDGTTESGGAVYALNTALDQQLEVATPPAIVGAGGFPALIPGVPNRIHMLRHTDQAGTLDAIGNTTTVRAFYWPRWLMPVRT
jgi:hypothetical protein